MIQYFDTFINHLDENKNDFKQYEHQYRDVYDKVVLPIFNETLPTIACPVIDKKIKCGAIDSLLYHSKYKRAVIRDIINGEIVEYRDVDICRFICSQCKITHALLVWFLPPWGRHTLRFIFYVLEAYYMNTMTVEALCIKFYITHPTLYAWDRKYRDQCENLRLLLNPPILPDITQQFEQWENVESLTNQPEVFNDVDPANPSIQNNVEIIGDIQKSVSDEPPGLSEPSGKRQGLISEFGLKIFIAIKTLIEQDTPAIFKDYYRTHRSAFFQVRQIQGGAGRPRASPPN